MVPDISNDRFDTWHAELGAFTCQSRKTDKQPNGPPDIAACFFFPLVYQNRLCFFFFSFFPFLFFFSWRSFFSITLGRKQGNALYSSPK